MAAGAQMARQAIWLSDFGHVSFRFWVLFVASGFDLNAALAVLAGALFALWAMATGQASRTRYVLSGSALVLGLVLVAGNGAAIVSTLTLVGSPLLGLGSAAGIATGGVLRYLAPAVVGSLSVAAGLVGLQPRLIDRGREA
jgi:hypothetical protein